MRVPYGPILVDGFRSVATFSQGWKPRLKVHVHVATDLKSETEIGTYGTHHVCHFLFLVPLINQKKHTLYIKTIELYL